MSEEKTEIPSKEDFNFKDKESWRTAINAEPNSSWIKERGIGRGKKVPYVPIEVKQSLQDVFFDEFDVVDAKFEVIVNEIICTVKISALPSYPNSEYRNISGSASKPIQCSSGSSPNKFPLGKITNSLEYNLPAVRSSAISNALETIGNVFGRNVARSVSNGYNMVEKMNKSKKKSKSKKKKK